MTRASLTKNETRSVAVQSFRTEILCSSPFWATGWGGSVIPSLIASPPTRACSKDFVIIHTSMASVVARAYNVGLGAEPPAGVQGAEPPVGGQGAPLKLTRFLCLKH